jgi:hypothetical protein
MAHSRNVSRGSPWRSVDRCWEFGPRRLDALLQSLHLCREASNVSE